MLAPYFPASVAISAALQMASGNLSKGVLAFTSTLIGGVLSNSIITQQPSAILISIHQYSSRSFFNACQAAEMSVE